jgi:uncharacterized Zn ribbon protein
MKQMICQNCGNTQPYDLAGHQGQYQCHKCGGDYCGCKHCNVFIEALERQDFDAVNLLNGDGITIIGWDCNTGFVTQ